ncbi:MAG: hypothetical protein WCP55_25010 [Lentisphaerota bacterium]
MAERTRTDADDTYASGIIQCLEDRKIAFSGEVEILVSCISNEKNDGLESPSYFFRSALQ